MRDNSSERKKIRDRSCLSIKLRAFSAVYQFGQLSTTELSSGNTFLSFLRTSVCKMSYRIMFCAYKSIVRELNSSNSFISKSRTKYFVAAHLFINKLFIIWQVASINYLANLFQTAERESESCFKYFLNLKFCLVSKLEIYNLLSLYAALLAGRTINKHF